MHRGPPPPRTSSLPSIVITARSPSSSPSSPVSRFAAARPLLPGRRVRGDPRSDPGVPGPPRGALVRCVGEGPAGPHREKIAGGGPLLAFRGGGARPAAEHRLERMVHRLHGGEEIG